MSEAFAATNAASSGIQLERKTLKSLCRRSDRPGLVFLTKWIACLLASGYLVHLAMDSLWLWPAMFVHGSVIGLPSYSMSHESAHGTAFRSRWLNELVFWITSLLYMEEPLYRRCIAAIPTPITTPTPGMRARTARCQPKRWSACASGLPTSRVFH